MKCMHSEIDKFGAEMKCNETAEMHYIKTTKRFTAVRIEHKYYCPNHAAYEFEKQKLDRIESDAD